VSDSGHYAAKWRFPLSFCKQTSDRDVVPAKGDGPPPGAFIEAWAGWFGEPE
jgi:hypothetical protein